MPDETESNASHASGGAYTGGEKINTINVADEIKNSFLDYSMSVIISRALPDVRDGLKPSQRRILYAMHELSLFPGRKPYKCAKICGDTSGNYHPHGEAVIYPTLVNMGQPWAMRGSARGRQGQFRFHRKRSAGGDALHRGTADASGRGADAGHGPGHGWILSRTTTSA